MPDSLPPFVQAPPQVVLEKLRSGEFFRESRLVYHQRYHDIMAERYVYLGITGFSVVILVFALVATQLFFPLTTRVPFVATGTDMITEVPRMQALGRVGEDANAVLRRFLVSHYVTLRESYDVEELDRAAGGVKSQSTEEVFAQYQALMDPQNPDSPIARFQRRATRDIPSIEVRPVAGEMNRMQVRFDAVITEAGVRRKEPYLANITFRFEDIRVDQTKGETTPLVFEVTEYHSKPVEE